MNKAELEPYEEYRRAVLHKQWALTRYQNSLTGREAAENDLDRCERELLSARLRWERAVGGL